MQIAATKQRVARDIVRPGASALFEGLRRLLRVVHEDWKTTLRDWTQPGVRTLALHRFSTWVRFRSARNRGPICAVAGRIS